MTTDAGIPASPLDAAIVRRLAVNESGFVFDPVTGRSFTVNDSGRQLLLLLGSGIDEDGVVARLAADYPVATDELRRDLHDFARLLREQLQ